MPLLLVERDIQDGFGVCHGFGCPEDKGIVVDFCDFLYFTELGAIHVLKFGVQWDIVSNSSIIILELLEADATYFNASIARGRTGLRMQIVNEHCLVIGESVLDVAIMQSQISPIVLAISRRC